MNKIVLKFFQLLIFCLCCLQAANAAPIAGSGYLTAADISYTCKGGNLYEVTLAVYAECDGEFTLENQNNYDVFINSASLGQAFQFKVTKVNSFEIVYYCASQLTTCNGGTNRGIRKYIYTGTVDLNKYAPAPDWKIYWRRDFRTIRLIHLITPQKEPYYVETNLNTKLAPCNNSPQIDGSAIFTPCIDSVSTYSLLALDKDGDELRYSFITPRNNTTDDLIYKTGYDKTHPVDLASPLTITSAGQISMKPVTAGDMGITDILIEEYRNGVKIASTTKGLQISTFACQNRKPSISDFPNSATNYLNYCVGDTIKIAQTNITSTDPDNDNVHFEVDQGPGGWFNSTLGKTANGYVSKIAKLSDVGKNIFTISAVDDGCPTIRKNTKTYTIEVSTPPVFDLGVTNPIACPKSTINPAVTGGKAPFTYNWFNFQRLYDTITHKKIIGYKKLATISTNKTYDVSMPQLIGLTITDANGCSFEDTTEYVPSLYAGFSSKYKCLGMTTELKDSSYTLLGEIVSRVWDVGDSSPLINDSLILKHIYQHVGEYTVTETVTNSLGCIKKAVYVIEICTIPPLVIGVIDSCQGPSRYIDITQYPGNNCAGEKYNWYVNGLLMQGPDAHSKLITINYPNTNDVSIKMEVTTVAQCHGDVTQVFHVKKDPSVLLKDISGHLVPLYVPLNCSQQAYYATTEITSNPNGGGTYNWQYTAELFPTTIAVTPDIFANLTGKYDLIFTDNLGCDDTASFYMTYPVLADFTYNPVCLPSDTMQFINKSVLLNTNQSSLTWDFGDGSPLITTSDRVSPKHKYAANGDFSVTVTAYDTASTCKSVAQKTVFNTFIKDIFRIEPDIVKNPICAQNILTGYSFEALAGGSHIDTIYWNFDNGAGEHKYVFPDGQKVNFAYTIPTQPGDSVTIKARVIYNLDPANHKGYCEYDVDSVSIKEIHPAFVGTVIPFRNCATDTAVFNFIKDKYIGDSTIKVKSWHWILSKQNSGNYIDILNPVIATADILTETFAPSFKNYFQNVTTTDYDIYLQAEDENGCKYGYKSPVKIAETAAPSLIRLDTVCQGSPSQIKFLSSNRTPSLKLPALASYYGFDANGDHTIERGNYESSTDTVTINYVFPAAGDIPVKIYMYEQTNVRSSTVANVTTPTECRAVIYDTLHVRPAPLLAFHADTVCAGTDATQFTNLTTAPNTNLPIEKLITGYNWNFGDNTKSTDVNPKHIFATGGKKYVTLTAHTKYCSFDYKDSIYVKHKPVADFDITVPTGRPGDSTSVESGIETVFVNTSQDGSEHNTVGFKPSPYGSEWNYGDGSPETSFWNGSHTYDGLEAYKVKLTVTNNEGCSASRIKVADTDSRLDLPNAFSPNHDGTNDQLGLVYKLILELYDYKIYNRWGQLVFDAGNNLEAAWDGKFNGVDQEVGVYVAYVKARGKYEKYFNFKKNITLLR